MSRAQTIPDQLEYGHLVSDNKDSLHCYAFLLHLKCHIQADWRTFLQSLPFVLDEGAAQAQFNSRSVGQELFVKLNKFQNEAITKKGGKSQCK